MQYSCLLCSKQVVCWVEYVPESSFVCLHLAQVSQHRSVLKNLCCNLLSCSDCKGAGDGHGCMVNKALEPLRRALKSCKDRTKGGTCGSMVALVGPCKFGSWKWNNEAVVHWPADKVNKTVLNIIYRVSFTGICYIYQLFIFTWDYIFSGIFVKTSLNIFTGMIILVVFTIYGYPSYTGRILSINIY